jgi:molybdenum cofactor cytidylyltransferase
MANEAIHIVILAAGASRRMGRPKQTLFWPQLGKTLLQHTVDEAEVTGLPITVILGAHAATIEDQIVLGHQGSILINPHWEEGMASSIRLATQEMERRTEAILFCVCDQPALTHAHLDALVNAYRMQEQTPLVASKYGDGNWGVPMLVGKAHFTALLALQGDVGAKKAIMGNPVVFVDFWGGEMDIDTL